MNPRRQKFVVFFSPGTLFPEVSQMPVEMGTIEEAIQLSKGVIERHDATPYAFEFVTRIIADPIDDGEGGKLKVTPKEVERSARHFIDGEVLLYENIVGEEEDGESSIAARNMKNSDSPIVVRCSSPFKTTSSFEKDHVVVSSKTMEISIRGDDPDLSRYREKRVSEWRAELKVWKVNYKSESDPQEVQK